VSDNENVGDSKLKIEGKHDKLGIYVHQLQCIKMLICSKWQASYCINCYDYTQCSCRNPSAAMESGFARPALCRFIVLTEAKLDNNLVNKCCPTTESLYAV